MSDSPRFEPPDRQPSGIRCLALVIGAAFAALALLAPTPGIANRAAHSRAGAGSSSDNGGGLPPPVKTPGWWNGVCDKNLSPIAYKGPTWHGLISCGPGGQLSPTQVDPAGDFGAYEHGPLSSNVEWQCVELVERWLYQEFHIPQVVFVANDPGVPTNGWRVVRHYAYYIAHHQGRRFPFRVITPASANKKKDAGLIGPGDVVSFGNASPGHTDLVEQSTVGPKGNGKILTLNQNLPRGSATGPVTMWLPVRNWSFQIYGLPATGWLHFTGGQTQAAPQPTKPSHTRCTAPAPFDGTGNPIYAYKVDCGHARKVVKTWNTLTAGTCSLDGTDCQVLDFTCRISGPNLQILRCSRQDGAAIRLDIGSY